MHSFTTKSGTTFNYNSDFSGDVRIKTAFGEMNVPSEDLIDLVAFCWVQPQRISKIEGMENADEIFDIEVKQR